MRHHRFSTLFKAALGLLTLAILSACGQAPTTAVPAATEPPAADTPSPTDIPAPTDTPAPTPLPGSQVLPLSSLDGSIPWLPLEAGHEPMSVFYGFNFNKPPFDNALVRMAFAAAVDKDAVAELARGFKFREVTPAMTITPSSVLGRDLYGEVGIPFDPAKAKSLLEQAGYTDLTSFPSPTLIVYLRGGAPGAHFRIAEAVVDMWETNLGITVTIEALENPPAAWERLESTNAEMFLLAWGADFNDPDNFLREIFRSASSLNHGHFYSPEFDRLVDQAADIRDPGERQLLYIQAEQIISERDAAVIPLFHSLWYTQL